MGYKKETEQGMKAAIDHLVAELKNIRTGRANPGMLDGVMVEVYGTPMRLRDIASVTTPEPRQLLITPYDQSNTATIGKAIERANLGIIPIVEGNIIRMNIPQMDTTVRKEMIKLLHKRLEEAKVSVRNVRADKNKQARREKGEGLITEDEVKKRENVIQELTDRYCKEADALCKSKEEEISTI